MSTKLIFTIPDVDTALLVVKKLAEMDITEDQISVIAKEGIKLDELPDPGEYRNDTVPAAQRGALFGGVTGLVAGLTATVIAPGIVLGGAALALATTGGATFGVLASTLVGASVPNSEIRHYEEKLEAGELLLIAELEEADSAEKIRDELQATYPQVTYEKLIDSATPPVV